MTKVNFLRVNAVHDFCAVRIVSFELSFTFKFIKSITELNSSIGFACLNFELACVVVQSQGRVFVSQMNVFNLWLTLLIL